MTYDVFGALWGYFFTAELTSKAYRLRTDVKFVSFQSSKIFLTSIILVWSIQIVGVQRLFTETLLVDQ